MTNLITEARELCERATPGPWGSRIDVGKKYYVFTPSYGVRDFCCLSGGFEHESDAAFIARSRTLIPELCDALEKAEAEIEKMKPFYKIADDTFRHWENAAYAMRDDERKKHRWVPVTERLPEEPYGCLVIVEQDDYWGEPREVMYPHFAGYDGEQWNDGDGDKVPLEITHWMPLPAAPEEGAEHERDRVRHYQF